MDGRAVHDGDERIIEESVIGTEKSYQLEPNKKLKRKRSSVEGNLTLQQSSTLSNEKQSRLSDVDDEVNLQDNNSPNPNHTIIPENINVIDMGQGIYGVRNADNTTSTGTYKHT